jgi:hypothetical protein
MSNIIPIDFSQVPAFARNKSAVAEALSGSLAGGIKRISIKGGTFRYIVGGQEIAKVDERYLDIVMVNAAPHVSRTWYAKDYDKDAKAEAPDCWSQDGTKPDPKAKNPQAATCLACPKNVKGSGKGDSRACRFNQRLAVVLANDIQGEVLQIQLPATSLFGEGSKEAGATLQGYYKALSARGIDPAALVTRMRFDTDVESPKLGFTAQGWLTQDQYNAAVEQGKSEAAQRAITMTVFEADGVDAGEEIPLPSGAPPKMAAPAPAPAPAPKPAAKTVAKAAVPTPAPTPAPAPSPAPAEPVADEPLVRKTVDNAPGITPEMQKLMEQWGTDD